MPNDITDFRRATETVKGFFVYKSDGPNNIWTILDEKNNKGDCEDFSLTVAYYHSGKSKLRMLYRFLNGTYKMHHVKTKSGVGHAVLEYNDLFVENIYGKVKNGFFFEKGGFDFEYDRPFLYIFKKVVLKR